MQDRIVGFSNIITKSRAKWGTTVSSHFVSTDPDSFGPRRRGCEWRLEQEVEKAQLTTEVLAVAGDVVWLRLKGETRTAAEGVWPVNDRWDQRQPKPQKRGFEARLLGLARYNTRRERFIPFEMLALGTRWGGTQYNRRADDLEPAPLGIVFTLAGETPAEQVARAFFRSYGWQ